MPRQRNNITRLSAEIRLRICELLDDGATYSEIRKDAEVAAECKERKLVLHNNTFLAYRKSDEFDEYRKRRLEWAEELERNNIAARFVEEASGSDNIARLANYEIMKICISKLQDGEELTPKELNSISSAVASYEKTRIAAEKEDTKREYAEKEAKYQAKIAELAATIEEITGKQHKEVDSKKVAEDLDAALGVR